MKKMFVAAMTAMALTTYGFAQDDEYSEDEEYSEPEESAAPAPKAEEPAPQTTAAAPSAAVNAGAGMLGFQIDMISAFRGDPRFYITYKISPAMEASLILGLKLQGETTYEAGGVSKGMGDDATNLDVGVGFDYYLTQKLLPICVGGEFVYSSRGNLDGMEKTKDVSIIEFNVLGGFRTEMTDNLYVTGKVGLNIEHYSWTFDVLDGSRTDIGLKAQAMLSWFFM